MNSILYAVLGFLLGLFAKFIYDWNLDRREQRTIRRSLLLEILYMHEPAQRLLLDKYREGFEQGPFQGQILGASFWRPSFPTKIYESQIAKIDRLLGSDLCLQLHYYYSLVDGLNERSALPADRVDKEFAQNYLDAVANTYAMGNGAVEAILGSPRALRAVEDNLRSLLKSFDDPNEREFVARLLRSYRKVGAAESIGRPAARRSGELLRRHWF